MQPTSQPAGESATAAGEGAARSRRPAVTGDTLAGQMATALSNREPGWRLPRRSALAKRYGTGISEIDAAIADLVRSSLIRRLPDGQLYRASQAGQWIRVEGVEGSAGLGTRLDPMGNTISCLDRQISHGEAPPDVAIALGQSPEARLRIVRCVWAAGDDPVAVSAAYLPGLADSVDDPAVAGDEPPRAAAPQSPWPAIAARVEVSQPLPEVVRALRVPPSRPVITVLVRFGAAADGAPAAITVVTLKPELFRVGIDVSAAAPRLRGGRAQ